MSDIPPDEVLPCGCVLRCSVIEGVNTFTIIACRQDCPNLRDALEMAHEENKPVEFREGP